MYGESHIQIPSSFVFVGRGVGAGSMGVTGGVVIVLVVEVHESVAFVAEAQASLTIGKVFVKLFLVVTDKEYVFAGRSVPTNQ